jgi:hypothetical protein
MTYFEITFFFTTVLKWKADDISSTLQQLKYIQDNFTCVNIEFDMLFSQELFAVIKHKLKLTSQVNCIREWRKKYIHWRQILCTKHWKTTNGITYHERISWKTKQEKIMSLYQLNTRKLTYIYLTKYIFKGDKMNTRNSLRFSLLLTWMLDEVC